MKRKAKTVIAKPPKYLDKFKELFSLASAKIMGWESFQKFENLVLIEIWVQLQ
jgi:hypothetical protein